MAFYWITWELHNGYPMGITLLKSPKKGKTITTETLHMINIYDDGNFSRQVPEKKDHVSVSKGVHKQKLGNRQKVLKLAKIIDCFQRKTP